MDPLEVFPKPIWFELTVNLDTLGIVRLRNASKSLSHLIDELMQNRWTNVVMRKTSVTKDEVCFYLIRTPY